MVDVCYPLSLAVPAGRARACIKKKSHLSLRHDNAHLKYLFFFLIYFATHPPKNSHRDKMAKNVLFCIPRYAVCIRAKVVILFNH